jgi:hypothetical protein
MGGECGAYGEERGVHRVLVGKSEGKRPLGRPRRSWEGNINTLRTGIFSFYIYHKSLIQSKVTF